MARLRPDAAVGYPGGMNDGAASTAIRRGEASQIINFRIATDTLLEVLFGSQRTLTGPLGGGAQGYGGTVFQPTGGPAQLIVFVGDTAYRSTDFTGPPPWTFEPIPGATGLLEAYWSLCTLTEHGTNYLCAANGFLYRYDGTTWEAVQSWPIGIRYVETFNRRLWGSDGKLLYAAAIDDMTVVAAPRGLFLPVVTHDAQPITGIRGLGPALLVGKRDSVGWVDGYGNSDVIVQTGAKGVSRSVGVLAHRAFVVKNETAYWLSEQGIQRYRWGQSVELASERIETTVRGINWSAVLADGGIPTAMPYPSRGEVWFAVPVGSTQNNLRIIINTRTGGITLGQHRAGTRLSAFLDADGYLTLADDDTRRHGLIVGGLLELQPEGVPGEAFAVDSDGFLDFTRIPYDDAVLLTADREAQNNAPISVGYDGHVRMVDVGPRFDTDPEGMGGDPIRATLVDRPRLYNTPLNRKRGRVLDVLVQSPTAAPVHMRLRGDGRPGKQFQKMAPAATGGRPIRIRARPDVTGRALEAEVETSAAGLKIAGIEVQAEVLREGL